MTDKPPRREPLPGTTNCDADINTKGRKPPSDVTVAPEHSRARSLAPDKNSDGAFGPSDGGGETRNGRGWEFEPREMRSPDRSPDRP